MKIIFGLILLILKGSSSQDLEARFETFINQTLSGLGDWIKENNFAPSPIPGTERFHFNGTGNLRTQLNGEIKNGFYHGAEQNISALRISSNLTELTFRLNFTHGSGSSDYVTGEYSINGRIPYPIDVSGNFARSNQTHTPLFLQAVLDLGVSPDGYFILTGGQGSGNLPRFANFLLEGMHGHSWESVIKPIVNSWYEMQILEVNDMSRFYYQYMQETFAGTPIVDIIGVPLPPTMTLAEAENLKKGKTVRKSEPFFDEETQQVLQKDFFFQLNR